MKLLTTLCLLAGFGLLAATAAEDPQPASPVQGTNAPAEVAPAETPPAPVAPAALPAVPANTNVAPAAGSAPAVEPPPYSTSTNEWKEGDGLRLNFRGAALETVLDYLSEAAGFIIVLETQPRGRVDVWSNQPVSKEEAVNLLNTVLRKNGYAAIRNGRQLTIVNRDEAKTKDIPVNLGSDPTGIPRTDEMVTQIIPIRFVEATQLIRDLQPLVSTQTAMTANESGNSIVITDTQANIHRVAQIIRAIDLGAEEFTVVRVFKLNNSDPTEMADLLTSLFPDESRSSSGGQAFGGFRGFFGRGGGPPGMGGNNSSGSANSRIRKHNRVLAVPDQRTSSVIVSASQDLMTQIEGVISDLDQSEAKRQTVKVIPMNNADPEQTLSVLQDIFQKNTSVNNRNSANRTSALENRSTQQLNQQNTSRRTSGRTGTSQGSMGR